MKLNEIRDNKGAKTSLMRVGRGIGSGKGKTAGRGGKGQTARSGVAINAFEGGQTPLFRRVPKRGFNNAVFKETFSEINLCTLQKAVDAGMIKAGSDLNVEALVAAKVIKCKTKGLCLLGKGTLKTALNLTVAKASKAAIAAVEKVGGKVVIIEKKVFDTKEAKGKGKSKDKPKAKKAAK